jgi:hypothetical protein
VVAIAACTAPPLRRVARERVSVDHGAASSAAGSASSSAIA